MTATATLTRILRDDQIDSYHKHSFLVLRQFFDRSRIHGVATDAGELLGRTDLIATQNLRCRWQNHTITGECLFETFDPVIDLSPACARIARDPHLLDALACLYGEPAFLFKDKLIFKPSGVKGYDLHQDFIGWKDFPRSFLTVLIPLETADLDNGCTVVYSGYHHDGYLAPEDGMYHVLPRDTVDESRAVPLIMEPGDIAIFGCFTPHYSSPNKSSRWRQQLYLSYNAASDGGERRAAHYKEFLAWLEERYAEYGKTDVYFR